jgi:hemerythrin-like metal-binding protein
VTDDGIRGGSDIPGKYSEQVKKLRIPAGLYDALPCFYVCAGLLAMIVLHNGLAVFMGLALVSAGGILGLLRYQCRRGLHQGAAGLDLPELKSQEAAVGGLVQISWPAAFDCGHPVIDGQRRRLFSLGSELINAVLMKQSRAQVERLIDELIERTIDHFRSKESVLAETNQPSLKNHQEIHRALLARAATVRDHFLAGEIAASELVGFISCEVMADYLISDSQELAADAKRWPAGTTSQSALTRGRGRGSAQPTGEPAEDAEQAASGAVPAFR